MSNPPKPVPATTANDPLRDFNATAALSGMLARADLSTDKPAAAATAYAFADAMMGERAKSQPAPPARTKLDPIAEQSPQATPTFPEQQQP